MTIATNEMTMIVMMPFLSASVITLSIKHSFSMTLAFPPSANYPKFQIYPLWKLRLSATTAML